MYLSSCCWKVKGDPAKVMSKLSPISHVPKESTGASSVELRDKPQGIDLPTVLKLPLTPLTRVLHRKYPKRRPARDAIHEDYCMVQDNLCVSLAGSMRTISACDIANKDEL